MKTFNPTILKFYTLKENEKVVEIENDPMRGYKVYALYVNGEYEKRLHIAKN